MKTQLVKYIRKNGNPVGCLIAVKNQDGEVHIGWSKYSKHEEKSFSKEEAKKLALSRSRSSFLFTLHEEWNMHWKDWSMTIVPNFPPSMRSDLLEFNERVFKFFKVDEIKNYMFTKTHDKEKVTVDRVPTGGWFTFNAAVKSVGFK